MSVLRWPCVRCLCTATGSRQPCVVKTGISLARLGVICEFGGAGSMNNEDDRWMLIASFWLMALGFACAAGIGAYMTQFIR